MLKETPKEFAERAAETFSRHAMRREAGWCWRCARPGTWCYGFRVVWMPGAIAIAGDLGALVVNHYSFTDPWSAAAWINGANWSYFMEKTEIGKTFDAEATAEHIVETAYSRLRYRSDDLTLFERIIDNGSVYGEASEPATRKEACRELLSSPPDEHTAYEITKDHEMLLYSYPERYRWNYEAIRWWAQCMWDTEPAWHKAVRLYRRMRGVARGFKNHPVVFGPILFGHFRPDGRITTFNGATFWTWDKTPYGRSYCGVSPWRIGGCDLSRWLGLWRRQGSVWPDSTTMPDRRLDERDLHWRPLTAQQTRALLAEGKR